VSVAEAAVPAEAEVSRPAPPAIAAAAAARVAAAVARLEEVARRTAADRFAGDAAAPSEVRDGEADAMEPWDRAAPTHELCPRSTPGSREIAALAQQLVPLTWIARDLF